MIIVRMLQLFKIFLFLIPALFVDANSYASSGEIPGFSKIPDVLVGFCSENSEDYAVVVEKSSQQLYLYKYVDGFKELFSVKCSTGKKNGIKSASGDKKTPEGVYFFTKKFAKHDLAPRYGSKAFPLDYPNFLDRKKGRNGYAIWLHGINKPLKSRNSNGCVALKNSDLELVSEYITLNRTPIILVETLSNISDDVREKIKKSALSALTSWKNSLMDGTYHQYLASYDSAYLPEIAWWTEWEKNRSLLIASGRTFKVELKNISVFQHNSVYVVLADLINIYDNKEVYIGTKKIFLVDNNGQLKIIGEEYQNIPEKFKLKNCSNPLIVSCRDISRIINADQEITEMIDGWLKAWSDKNIKEYGKYYAKDFLSKGINKKRWLRHKRALNRKYKYIKVEKADLVINKGKRTRKVSFIQTYRSDRYKAVGRKQLLLKLEKGEWKIYRETWEKI